MPKLTAKQDKFISEYLIDHNATQAAKRAGYSEKTAKEQGSQNLTKLHIQKAIEAAHIEAAQRNEITVDVISAGHMAAYEIAKELKQPGPMTNAMKNLSELHGHTGKFSVDIRHNVQPVTHIETVYVSPDDINPDTGKPYNYNLKNNH